MMRFQPRYPTFSSPQSSSSFGERVLFGVAVLLLIIGLIGLFFDRKKYKYEIPVAGGTYTEGIIADSPTKVERIITRLTNIGLTYRESDGTIKPALAESWAITNDNKTYTFKLRSGYPSDGVLATIQNSKTNWTDLTITAPSPDKLQFTLNEPLSVFLSTTNVALFPYGPYKVVKRDKREIILRPNPDFVLGQPYIQKIIIKPYDNTEQLLKAAKDGEINGSADFDPTETPKSFEAHTVDLPRYYILFFNMTKPVFKKIEDRQRVVNQTDGPPVTYTLLTSQTGISSDLADSLAKELATKHMTLDIQKKNSINLQKEDIPKREFDLLLYGINYGIEPDYYSFWHSSQVASPGLNLAGVKDKELDKLVEAARKEQDPLQRVGLNKQIEDYLSVKALQKIVNQEKAHFAISRSIKGVKYGTIDEGNDRFNLVWRWYIKSKLGRTPPTP
jgi:ABC-type oligopeptide transport system substrate-binding subunit